MNELDYLIHEKFRLFDLSVREFNSLPEDEKEKYSNTLRFLVKEALSRQGTFAFDPETVNRAMKKIDKRVEDILFA